MHIKGTKPTLGQGSPGIGGPKREDWKCFYPTCRAVFEPRVARPGSCPYCSTANLTTAEIYDRVLARTSELLKTTLFAQAPRWDAARAILESAGSDLQLTPIQRHNLRDTLLQEVEIPSRVERLVNFLTYLTSGQLRTVSEEESR